MRWSWPVLLPLLMQLFLRLRCLSEHSEWMSHCSKRRRDYFPLWLPRQHTQINASVVAQTALRSDLRYVYKPHAHISPCCGEHTTCHTSAHTNKWTSHDVSVCEVLVVRHFLKNFLTWELPASALMKRDTTQHVLCGLEVCSHDFMSQSPFIGTV